MIALNLFLLHFYCIFCNRNNIGMTLSILLSLYFDNKNILLQTSYQISHVKKEWMFVLAHKSTDQCHYMTTKDPQKYVYIHIYCTYRYRHLSVSVV